MLQCREQQEHRGIVSTTLGPHSAPDRQMAGAGLSTAGLGHKKAQGVA